MLLTNLGTPDAPTASALRRYLREFLPDPRVIEFNKFLWWLILKLFILPFRPRISAAKYKRIWTKEGSPLLIITKDQADGLREYLEQELPGQCEVEIGMRYGNPSVESGIRNLLKKDVDRLLVVPLYPQYAAATTGSTFDAVADAMKKVRAVPDIRFTAKYHDEDGYIDSLVQSIREVWSKGGQPEKLIFSYHGIPERYFLNGDPYFCHCHKTSRLVAERLGITNDEYIVCFQSTFGREEWLKPGTIQTVEELARHGVKKLDVICPGFSADCLETIDEIDRENREEFMKYGGKEFRYIPCLNARPDFIEFLGDFVLKNISSWANSPRETAGDLSPQSRPHLSRPQ